MMDERTRWLDESTLYRPCWGIWEGRFAKPISVYFCVRASQRETGSDRDRQTINSDRTGNCKVFNRAGSPRVTVEHRHRQTLTGFGTLSEAWTSFRNTAGLWERQIPQFPHFRSLGACPGVSLTVTLEDVTNRSTFVKQVPSLQITFRIPRVD
ncbi:hypothetical protein BaRGS_00017796 [Batillaria attramentaria]|uniref:Uncharacterized protein n=1 Tax=Batillaria attramentaria TaxID=370345 RepID=A0ABD0KUU5_9CAEN